jgi:hypothetical protein
MDWKKVGQAVADAAPILGSLAGGPAGGAVGALIASTLGTASDPDAVVAKIKSDPDSFLKLQELEKTERETLRTWQLETLKAELADTQDARKSNAGHWMPSAITIFLTCMVCAIGYAVCALVIPPENKDMAVYIFGVVTGAWSSAIAYWIGTSRTSFAKDALIAGKP